MALGGQLQAAAGGEVELIQFTDDEGNTIRTQGLFHRPEGFLIVARRHQHQPGGIDIPVSQPRCIEILMRRNPQTGAVLSPWRQVRANELQGEESRQGRLFPIEAEPGDFMQRIPRQATAEMPVDMCETQRQDGRFAATGFSSCDGAARGGPRQLAAQCRQLLRDR